MRLLLFVAIYLMIGAGYAAGLGDDNPWASRDVLLWPVELGIKLSMPMCWPGVSQKL